MADHQKTNEELKRELGELRKNYESLKTSCEKTKQNNDILLSTIINNIPSSVFVKDKNYRKILANNSHLTRVRAHLRSLGLDPDIEILDKTDFEVTPVEISEEYFSDDKKVVQFGESIIGKEESGYNPEGKPINLVITKVPLLNYLDEIIGMVGVTTDITELRQVGKEVLLKNKELIKSNAEKDKFFSIIAHDLRSPFNSILGFSEMLIEQVKNKNFDRVEEYANIILKSSIRAVDLLMNLMYWAQSQTGRIKFKPEHIILNNLLDETILLLSDTAHYKKISISHNLPVNVQVYADKAMISTVFRNLVSNAIKYSYPSETILISVDFNEDMIVISVKDNGVGMPKDVMEKLFRIDENQSSPGTQNEKGTGLGLILCKEFVEMHKGKIWCESKINKGSVFNFSLPLETNNK